MALRKKLKSWWARLTHPTGHYAGIGVKTNVHVQVRDKNGKKKVDRHVRNVECNEGLEWIKGHCHDVTHARPQMDVVEVGSSSAAVDPTDDGCTTPIVGNGLAKALGGYSSGATGVCTITKSFSVTGTETVEETALLNDTGGTEECLAHVLTGTVDVSDGDTLQIVWTITYS